MTASSDTEPTLPPVSDSTTPALLKRIVNNYMRPRWKRIAFAMILMLTSSGLTAAQAYLLEPIINKIFVQQLSGYLLPIGLAIILVFVLRGLTAWGSSVMMAYVGQDILASIQSQVFHSLIRQDMRYFQQSNAGKLTAVLVSDVPMMRAAMADALTAVGKNLVTLIFLVGVMLYQDWRMSLMALVVFPPAGFMVAKIGKRIRQVAGSTQEQYAMLTGLLSQSFSGVRQVKAYNAEEHEDERIEKTLQQITKLSNKTARTSEISSPISEFLSGLAIAIIIVYGGSQVIAGHNTPGGFMSFIAAFMLAYEPLKRLGRSNATIQVGLAAALRVFKAIDLAPEIADKPKAVPLVVRQPSLVFDDVSFAYADGTQALDHVSFHVEAGQKAALVGPSGSGKTTCLQLLLRFYEPQQGRILIDGHDIRDITLHSLRDAISFVSQDVFIFDDTARSNIAYGRMDADDSAIIEAAQRAAAHEFIMNLQDGYDTPVGELGTKLSGGQKQRLAIARALLKDSPILLLDEATSALDNESEKLVTQALRNLEDGRTTLVVAHRLSTIRDADQIIVMSEGRVTSSGTHDVLMKQDGLYPILYASMLS